MNRTSGGTWCVALSANDMDHDPLLTLSDAIVASALPVVRAELKTMHSSCPVYRRY